MIKYLKLFRVKHYIKNILIFLPLLFSHQFKNINLILSVFIAFISFSLLCSAIYIFNDIKDKDLDRIRKVVSDIKEHILVLNGGNESAADDEVSLLNNLINNKEYYEDKDTSQLLSNHLVNLGTGDIGISIDRITYGQEGRLMVYKYKIGNQDYLKRIRMNQSLDELYEEEMKKDKDIMEYSKDQKEKIERDIKNGII